MAIGLFVDCSFVDPPSFFDLPIRSALHCLHGYATLPDVVLRMKIQETCIRAPGSNDRWDLRWTPWSLPLGLWFVVMALGTVAGWADEDIGLRPLDDSWQVRGQSMGEVPSETIRTVVLPTGWGELTSAAGASRFQLLQRLDLPTSPLATASTHLALWVPYGGTISCTFFVDGQERGSLGTASSPRTLRRSAILPLGLTNPAAAQVELRFDCHRPHGMGRVLHDVGPFGGQLLLGDERRLLQWQEVRRLRAIQRSMPWLLLPAFLFTVGIYHVHLALRRRRLPEYLWFGFLAIDLALVTFFNGWSAFLPWPEQISDRLLEAGSHLLLVLLFSFFQAFLDRQPDKIIRGYQMSHAFWAIWVLLMPGYVWVLRTEDLRRLWGLPGWLYLAGLLVLTARRSVGETRWVSLGGLGVVISGLFVWLVHLFGAGKGFGVLPWSFLLFTVTLALALARKVQRANQALDNLRLQLEDMVDDRTTELSVANDQLKAEIAERQLAEEAMRMLERAVEQSIDGILVVDLEGSTQFANQAWAQMHGAEVFELLGQNLTAFHSPSQMERQVEPALEQVRRQGTFEGEIGHRRRDGDEFPTWTSISLLRDGAGDPVGFVSVGRDISASHRAETQRLMLEQKVQQSRKLESLGNLASGLAHDYNNLLTGVLGNVSLLHDSLPKGSLLDRLTQVEAAAERAVDLTSQLRSYAGEDTLLLTPVECDALLKRMTSELQRLMAGSADLQLELQPVPPIPLDASQVRRVIRNLVSNAAEATTGSGGLVTLRTSIIDSDHEICLAAMFEAGTLSGSYLCLQIEDNGKGMDEDVQAKMFDPFFTTRPSARGLGLAIVLGIVRAHGGAVHVASEAGVGTTISVLLPVLGEALVVSPEAEDSSVWQGTGHILVVDDEELMREVSSSILESQGFDVLTAAAGDEAVDLFKQHHDTIRLVLLDRTMPGMDGDVVLERIRQIDPTTAVLLMSGYKEKDALRGLDPGSLDGFLPKPFRPTDLLRELRRALDSRENVR